MAVVPQGASVGTIADAFGALQSTPISQLALIVGLAATAPISGYYGKEPTPTPTPAPTFASSPQITPTTGTAGTTQYSVSDPLVNGGNITARDFIINSVVVGSGNSVIQNTAGDMYWRVTATGPGGTSYYYTNTVSVVAPVTATFSPDGGPVAATGSLVARISITCDKVATWTYSTTEGFGGSVNIASGGTTAQIIFTVTAGGASPNRFDRRQVWTVRGEANGVIREFTVDLWAFGDNS